MTFSLPPDAGTITGPSSVCAGTSITLSDVAAGVWSSGNTNATVSAGGVVTGVTAGTAVISYTATTLCASQSTSASVTVNPQPVAGSVSGLSAVCVGSSIPLSDGAIGGVWSSSNTFIAIVDGSGNVTGASAGPVTINYSVTNICNTAVAPYAVTVNPLPVVAAITGSSNVCVTGTVILSDATPGGLWSSSNTNISIVSGAGLAVTGISPGTSVISYTVTNGFGCATTVMTTENSNALPVVAAITGASFGCVGLTNILSDATSGGVWSSSDLSLATIDPSSGQLSAIAPGAFTVSYTVTNIAACSTTVTFADTIKVIPVPTFTTGVLTICAGQTTMLSNATAGGIWSSTNGLATVSNTGVVTAISGGTDYIIYDVSNSCATVLDSSLLTINALPSINIITTANNTICAGNTTTLNDATTGGVWNTSNSSVAIVSNTGVVTGLTAGSAGISYTVTNIAGCSITTIIGIFVGPAITHLCRQPGRLCHTLWRQTCHIDA